MKLVRAFDIRAKDVVSLVGGGGKTSAMFRLADELVSEGKRVVTTTTTRIFAAQIQLSPFHIFVQDSAQALRDTQAALGEHPHVLVIGAKSEDGKAFGVEPDLIDRLISLDEVDVVIVEADGSRMRPFKAPNDREPVIPQSTTLLVPVVGIDVLGAPLDDEHVHRPELVSRLVGIPMGTPIGAEQIARVVVHDQGGLQNKPIQARVIPLINKVETDVQATEAREIAILILRNDAVDAVAIGSVRNRGSPISSRRSRVSAVVLAAGGSIRMQGEIKQLLPWGDATLVRNAMEVARKSQAAEIVVVTGSRAAEVEKEIFKLDVPDHESDLGRVAHNADWATGRASSVRVGLRATSEKSAAAIFINADQPFLSSQVLDTILETFFRTGAPIVVPTYDGDRGSPVLFARELFDELGSLRGEQGGRDIYLKYVDVLSEVAIEDARAAVDLDTPAEYQAARGEVDGIDAAQTGAAE